MKKFFKGVCCLACLALLVSEQAHADLVFSRSSEFANAGTTFNSQLDEELLVYVWASTEAGQSINGMSLDITTSNSGLLTATGHEILNPDLNGLKRWTATTGGSFGSGQVLVDNSNGFSLFDSGLSTIGPDDFVLHSIITLRASGFGSSQLGFAEGNNQVTDTASNNSIWGSFSTGNAQVNISSVPEPASAAFGIFGLLLFQARRKRK